MIKRYKNPKLKRQARVRFATKGTTEKPRLSVFRSNKHIYGQIIDDSKGITLAAVNGNNLKEDKSGVAKATLMGTELAKKALKKKVKRVVFDRGRFKYHGQVKALAEAAKKAGLKF